MPICKLFTNLPARSVPKTLHTDIVAIIAKVLNKPEEKISVLVVPDQQMCRGISDEGTAMMDVWSMNVFSPENNPKYAGPILDLLTSKLGLPEKRIAVTFHDLKPFELAQKP